MPTLRRIDLADCQALFARITDFAHFLGEKLPIREIYLFGSFATHEIHEGSDIDLLIVGDFRERFFERIGKILALTDLPIEPLVYTPEEFDELKRSENPFILSVLKTGKRLVPDR